MKYNYYEGVGEKVYSEKLQNGLYLSVVQKRGYAKKYAFFATNYGGADRRFKVGGNWIDTPEGVAHFLEHKMFDTKDGNALTRLSENGASPNAYTSSDMTAYHFSCIDKFYENLQLLLSFVSVPYFTADSVEKEQGIIGQEIRMTEDQPGYAVYYNLMKCLYKSHPLRYSVAGTVESISEITPQTLYDCHNIFYNPSNMVLCVVGDVDPDRVLEIANSVLPQSPSEIPHRDYGPDELPTTSEKSCTVNMDVGMPMFMAGFKCGISFTGREYLKKRIIATLAMGLLVGQSSPLYSRLYSEGLITSGFSADFETVAGQSHVVFSDECRSPDKVAAAILEEAARISREGIDNQQFMRRKKAFRGMIMRSMNSFERICAEAADAYFNSSDAFIKPEILDSITIDDITDFIKSNLTEDRFAISIINPIEKSTGA